MRGVNAEHTEKAQSSQRKDEGKSGTCAEAEDEEGAGEEEEGRD